MADKIQPVYPKAMTKLSLKVEGIFGFPQEWKTTDEANPGMFTYTTKFCNMEIINGKVAPRELTQKQIRQQEESKKKGGKKQAKKQQNPAQAEKLRQILEKEEAEQKKREEILSKMTEQQRIHYIAEDKYKSSSIKFEHSLAEKQFTGNLFVVIQQRIQKDKGQWIYIYKCPTANEQDLQKLKKSKPKNLNIADLNPICMRAWVNLESLNSSDKSEAHDLRCKIIQVDASDDTPKPNLQKAYIKITVSLNEPVKVKLDKHTVSTIIKDPPQPKPVSTDIKCVQQMRQQLRLAIQSIAMQYSTMFWRDLNANQQQKSVNIFVSNKKNEHNRRKQQFLYDFNVSGKYKVLKERLKKIIVHLCESKFSDKMERAKSFTGITCSVRDQFYSEIYNFLVTSYSQTMGQLIQEKQHKLKEVFVLNEENQNKLSQELLQSYRPQTQNERFNRIINEYTLVGDFQYGQQMYKSAIAKQGQNIALKYQYSIFCLKNGLCSANQVLSWGYIDKYMEFNKNDRNLQIDYVTLMIGSEDQKSLKKAWIIIRQLLVENAKNIKFILMGSLCAELNGKIEVADKLKFKAYREELRNHSVLKEAGKHYSQPINTQIPSLHSVANYKTELKPQQKDNVWVGVVANFSEFGLFNIVQKIKSKLLIEDNPKIKNQQIKILYSQQNYKNCLDQAIALYNNIKSFETLQIVINCCDRLNQLEQKIKYLKMALTSAPQQKRGYVLINLGSFYIKTKKFGNAKACMAKYIQMNPQAGGLAWLLMGQAQLQSNNLDVAVECFRHSNICDPYNNQVWAELSEAYCRLKNYVMVNQCLNYYLQAQQPNKLLKSKLQCLKQRLIGSSSQNFYESSIKDKILRKMQAY